MSAGTLRKEKWGSATSLIHDNELPLHHCLVAVDPGNLAVASLITINRLMYRSSIPTVPGIYVLWHGEDSTKPLIGGLHLHIWLRRGVDMLDDIESKSFDTMMVSLICDDNVAQLTRIIIDDVFLAFHGFWHISSKSQAFNDFKWCDDRCSLIQGVLVLIGGIVGR